MIKINADDFGRNSVANRNIIECFNNGLINSATIMMNMPDTKNAIKFAKEKGFLGKLGVHIVLDEGIPLTTAMRNFRKFCDNDGTYKKNIPRHQYLNREERKIIYDEVIAQINSAKKNGLYPTHLDSHRHRHQDFWVALAVKKAAIDSGIGYIRRHKSGAGLMRSMYACFIDLYYKIGSSIKTSDCFYSIFKYPDNLHQNNLYIEIMCHPENKEDVEALYVLKEKLKNCNT